MNGLLLRRREPPRLVRPGPVITSDTFAGDIANINGRALDLGLGGSAKTWTQIAGITNGIGTSGGKAVRQATGSTRRYNFDAGVGDVFVSVLITTKPSTGVLYINVRSLDIATETYIGFRLSSTAVQLFKHVAGVTTAIGAAVGIADGSTVSVLAIANRLFLGVNSYQKVTAVDTDVSNTQTGVGITVESTATDFSLDDFYVAAA